MRRHPSHGWDSHCRDGGVAVMRWTPQRKLKVVREYLSLPYLSVADLASKYGVKAAEIEIWAIDYSNHGLSGLCVTKRMSSL